ncbi:MAG TPA: hypothetical protein VFD82_14385 [Planctomycetota bacterium]|nr:hypothetical protein [Planctomycetota bacterium]
MRSRFTTALAALFLTTIATAQTCPSMGVSVDASGGRLGDAWRVDIQASPTVFGVLGLDFAPGPVPTPIGTICLGLTPSLLTVAFATDPSGAAAFTGLLPPVSAFAGIDIYAAAVTLDAAQPTGWGVSNGDSLKVREPRFWYVSPGTTTPFGTTPGAIAATDVIADNMVFSQTLSSAVRDVATVSERGWLAVLQTNGALAAYDGSSPTPVLSMVLTGTAAGAGRILALPGGDALLLLSFGTAPSPFGGGTPGSVHHVTLPGGVVTSTSLPAGNPDAIIHVPGTSLVYLRVANGVIPFDYSSAQPFPLIALPSGFGGFVDWQVSGGLLYVLHGGQAAGPFSGGQPAAISVIDAIGQTALSTNQLAMTAPVQMLRAGLGSAGPALYVYGNAAASLQEFAQVTVAPVATIPLGPITAMELSSLGNFWFMLSSAPASLIGLPVGTTSVVTLAGLSGVPQPAIAVSPSASYGKVGIVVSNNVTAPFQTDPVFAAGTSVVLPIASAVRILPD